MIVELVGLPGAGKTTFAGRTSGMEGWSVVRAGGRTELLFYNTLFLIRHPLNFFRTLFLLVRYRGRRELWYTKFVNLFLVHNAKYMKACRYPRAIIDQGHHQNVISLFDERVSDDVVDRYVRSLPKPDLLVFFVVTDDVRTRRLKGRGYGARDRMDEEYREGWKEARAAHFERLYVSRSELPCATETVSPEDEEAKWHKIAHARLWHFVLHGRMPTEKAHGLQVAKTLEAFSGTEAYATLWIPRGGRESSSVIAAYYGLDRPFPVRTFSVSNFLRLPASFGPLRFWLDALAFSVRLVLLRLPKDGVFFTRSPELAWLFTMKGVSAWYEAHGFPATKKRLLAFFLRHVDGIIANSRGTADAFVERGFSDVHVVRNGVDLKQFAELPQRAGARKLLELPKDRIIVMYVGAFYAWKGVLFLLEAWRRHFGDREDLLLVLVGGTEEDLKRYGGVGAYHASSNVLLVPHVPAEKARIYLSAADILVLPNSRITEESVRFTSPIKLFEYMAAGKPVIAADLPSIREVLKEGLGIFFQADSGDALKDAITATLSSPDDALQMANRARKEVRAYSWEARARLLTSIVRGHAQHRVNPHMQFLKSVASVGITAVVYFSLIYLLTEYTGLWHLYSILIAYISAVAVNFFLLKLVFVGGKRKISGELSIFLLLVLANLLMNEIAAYILVERLNLWYMLAQVLIIGTLAIVNFFIYRSYVFPRGEQ